VEAEAASSASAIVFLKRFIVVSLELDRFEIAVQDFIAQPGAASSIVIQVALDRDSGQ
jgi:hypothetical protein